MSRTLYTNSCNNYSSTAYDLFCCGCKSKGKTLFVNTYCGSCGINMCQSCFNGHPNPCQWSPQQAPCSNCRQKDSTINSLRGEKEAALRQAEAVKRMNNELSEKVKGLTEQEQKRSSSATPPSSPPVDPNAELLSKKLKEAENRKKKLQEEIESLKEIVEELKKKPSDSPAVNREKPYEFLPFPDAATSEGAARPDASPTLSPPARFVRQLFKTRGTAYPKPMPVAGFELVEVAVLKSDCAGFEARLKKLTQLRQKGGTFFNPPSSKFDTEQLQTLIALRELFEPRPGTAVAEFPNLIYTFHGTRMETLDSVCSSGLVSVGGTDAGFFGSGVYTTPNIEYAARYAVGQFDPPEAPVRTRRPDGCVPVVMFCVAVGVAYPITPSADYKTRTDGHCDFFGAPLKKGFDSHVTCVSETVGFESVHRNLMQYLEVVVDQENQAHPMATLWIRESS
jgi:hypothetical protein